VAQGSGKPTMLLKNWRLSSTRLTSATGALRNREASRVKRSNDRSAGLSINPVNRSAFKRAGSDCPEDSTDIDEVSGIERPAVPASADNPRPITLRYLGEKEQP
jgi:hypothetical protein